jgi:hypothetical protein
VTALAEQFGELTSRTGVGVGEVGGREKDTDVDAATVGGKKRRPANAFRI